MSASTFVSSSCSRSSCIWLRSGSNSSRSFSSWRPKTKTWSLSSRAPHLRRGFAGSSIWQEKRYTSAHEWVELSPDGKTGTIGISTYAAAALGDVVFVELPTTDQEVAEGDSIGAVESVKSASDIYAPISGKIVEANSLLEEKPGTINKGPESEGWIAKIEVKDATQVDGLMDAEAYQKHTEE